MSDNLKHVYDNSNKVTESGLSVTYRQNFNGEYWEITRFAKKSYSFVGMDKDTAYACASAKRSQYTRSFSRITTITENGNQSVGVVNVIECPSDIAPLHGEGGVWSVQIAVNEEDVIPSPSWSTNPSSLFSAANGRNYDEDAGAASLTISGASRSGDRLSVSYSCGIPDAKPAAIIVQYKAEESSAWTTIGSVDSLSLNVPTSGSLSVRLVFGTIESNTVTVS